MVTWKQRTASLRKMLLGQPESPASPQDVTAKNYIEATQYREGLTIEGDVYKTATHVGRKRWRLGVKRFEDE